MKGFSDTLLKNHFKLYEGYVSNTNKLLVELNTVAKEGKAKTPYYSELKRRFGWEFNGMRLHEHYFDNLTPSGSPLPGETPLSKKLAEDFGSFEDWEKDFKATGAMRGIGWVVLYFDGQAGRLINSWIDEHDSGHLTGCAPILVMDVFEHAFLLDYGLERGEYIEAFFKAVNWSAVGERFQQAKTAASRPAVVG